MSELENKFDVRNTRTGNFTDDLKRVLQAHQELHKDGLVGGVAHISLDTSDAAEGELPRGMVMLYDRNAKLNPSDIPNTLGQYLMVAELMPRPQGYKDADFHSEEARRALNENIPQYNTEAPSYDLRHPRTNQDVDAWGPELGQEDGAVGVYKVMEPNGRDARYYLAVKSSIPEVVQKFKQDLARSGEGTQMTFGNLIDDKRLHYVDYLGRRNGYKLMYAAMKALGVGVPHGVDGDHYVPAQKSDASTAPSMRAEPEHVHAVTTIEPIIQGGHERIAVYNGLAPSHQCGEKCFTYVSPYDGIVRFNMNGRSTGLALPVVTGRKTPQSVEGSAQGGASEADILKRAQQSSIIWEQSAKHPAHPDLHPDSHHQVDKDFLRSMQQSGWNREHERDLMVPVLLKISNPALRRPGRDQGKK